MPKKVEPITIYGKRCRSLKDLAQACDDMKASAARYEATADAVVFEAYVGLEEVGDGFRVKIEIKE